MSAERRWVGEEDRSLEAPDQISVRRKEMKPTVLIVPDRSHTGAVSMVTAAEDIAT